MINTPTPQARLQPPVTRRQWLRMSLGSGAMFSGPAVGAATKPPALTRLHWEERVLLGFGTTLWLRGAHNSADKANAGLDAAVTAIRHVEKQMSLFDPTSAVSRLNRNGILRRPHADLLKVLRLARLVASKSHGAFDVTVQPLWRVWARAQVAGRLPRHEELQAARARIDWRAIELGDNQIRLTKPNMAITLNGIAQGYAADLAGATLREHGIEHALLDTGEWAPIGVGPNDKPWTLGVENPRLPQAMITAITSDGRSIATSSDAHYTFSADRRHHHILNPITGDSPSEMASITVAAKSCALADALTKVMFMGTPEQALEIAASWQVDVLAVDKAGNWLASPGLQTV